MEYCSQYVACVSESMRCVCAAGGPERAQGLIWVPEFFKSRWLIKLIRELKRVRRRACQSQMDGIVGLSLRVQAGTPPSLFFHFPLSFHNRFIPQYSQTPGQGKSSHITRFLFHRVCVNTKRGLCLFQSRPAISAVFGHYFKLFCFVFYFIILFHFRQFYFIFYCKISKKKKKNYLFLFQSFQPFYLLLLLLFWAILYQADIFLFFILIYFI